MKIRLRKSDILFSQYIRQKAGWKCERCKTQYEPPTNGLQNSHFWGRANESTRFDPMNCDCLCFKCHQHFTANPELYREWKLKKLGEKEYKALRVRALINRKKRDDKLDVLICKKLLEVLNN